MGKDFALAIDIGGTKTIVGLVDQNGKILIQKKFPTNTDLTGEEHLSICHQFFVKCLSIASISREEVAGIGVSVPGTVNPEKGILLQAPYAGWKNLEVKSFFKQIWPEKPVQVENDVNACAIGEKCFGIGKEISHYAWVTISTGIGGALINNDRLVHGQQFLAGEIGHFIVEWEKGLQCGCGNFGCLEAHASGTAITRMARKIIQDAGDSSELNRYLLEQEWALNAESVAEAAYHGVEEAIEIYEKAAVYLGRVFSYMINLFNPGAIVVGGGVSRSFSLLEPTIHSIIQKSVIGESNKSVPILKTELGYEAGLIGAASLVMRGTKTC